MKATQKTQMMVKINRIYTRTGDTGETHLVGGQRVAKDSLRVCAYGDVDDLNAQLGLARTHAQKSGASRLEELLGAIQNELFDLGSELATPAGQTWEGMITMQAEQATTLEQWIDELTENLPELKSFVLPGGNELNATLHIARTVCRRAERTALTLSREEPVSRHIIIYLNRLSDLLFAMARYESHRAGIAEYLWKPGQTTKAKT